MIEQARTGDLTAFAVLVRRHQATAYRVAFLITRSAADADDALQEGLIRAHRALPRFRTGEPFRPWLTTIVANQARNRARSRRRAENLVGRLASVADIRTGEDPETAAIREERRRRVIAGVESLPERFRRAVALRHLLGLTEAETAQALGVAVGTVKSRVARGLHLLRESIGDSDD